MSISNRISDLVEHFANKNNSRFANIIGTSEANVRNYLNGVQPKFDFIAAIADKFEINCEWLLTGKGEMLNKEKKPYSLTSLPTSSTAVPFYNVPVSAGPLGVLTYSCDALKPDGYIDIDIFRHCDAILPVTGVSMEPEIHSGDLIGIKKLEYYNWEYVQTGKIYMIITHEDRMIKYISKADDSEYIVCSSPNYHDFKVRKNDVLEIYRVIASIKSF